MRTRMARQSNTGIFQLKVDHCARVCAKWNSGVGIERKDCLDCCPYFVMAESSSPPREINPVQCSAPVEELVALTLMED